MEHFASIKSRSISSFHQLFPASLAYELNSRKRQEEEESDENIFQKSFQQMEYVKDKKSYTSYLTLEKATP